MKNKTMTLLAAAGVLAVFNILFFIWTGSERSAVAWIGYGFMTLSFVILVLTYIFPRKGRGETYSLVVPQVAVTYMALTAVLSVVLMILTSNTTIALTLELLLSIYYVTNIVIHVQANRRTAANEEARQRKVDDLKKLAAQVKIYIDMNDISNQEASKAVGALYDELLCAPVRTSSNICLSDMFSTMMPSLGNAIYNKNWSEVSATARRMQMLVRQRNIS